MCVCPAAAGGAVCVVVGRNCCGGAAALTSVAGRGRGAAAGVGTKVGGGAMVEWPIAATVEAEFNGGASFGVAVDSG